MDQGRKNGPKAGTNPPLVVHKLDGLMDPGSSTICRQETISAGKTPAEVDSLDAGGFSAPPLNDLTTLGTSTNLDRAAGGGENFSDGTVASPDGFDMKSCMNGGRPIMVEWDNKEREFIDGFGLCSPTRWRRWK